MTTAGRFLYSEAEQIFRRVDEATVALRRLAAGTTGFLRLGMSGVAVCVTPAYRAAPAPAPGSRLPVVGDGIETVPFVTERMLLAMPDDHPLAGKPDLAPPS